VATDDRKFFGHPIGLSTLFFTEMWERFSYYGMRGFLILFMGAPLAAGGMGLDNVTATAIYGTYTAMVYLMSVPGGWLADRVFGQRKSVLYGGILIAVGHFTLALPSSSTFFFGLIFIVLGTGLLKPNISVIVGQLYAAGDVRRDAAFSIFYMGINLGGFLGPAVTGYLAQQESFRNMIVGWGFDPNSTWHFAFGAAGVGMTLGLIQYVLGGRKLGTAGIAPGGAPTPELAAKYKRQATIWLGLGIAVIAAIAVASMTGALTITPTGVRDWVGYALLIITVFFFANLFMQKEWTSTERARLVVIFIFFACASVFWSVFEQAGSTLNLFADRSTANTLFGFNFPSSWFQSLNSFFIVVFAPVIAWVWIKWGSRQPSAPTKFAWGLVGVGLGFMLLVIPAKVAATPGVLVSPMWLTSVYFIHTIAELLISPVGLSSMTKLAPPKIVGAMMGVWFLGASVGNFLAGSMAGLYEEMPLETLFWRVSLLPIAAGLVMLVFSKKFTAMMGGAK
jgi:POT family proton-dependent oligopeptide transporter